MPENGTKKKSLLLRVLIPSGTLCETECDSVTLIASQDEKEKLGGSVGIRPGHTKAVISLDRSIIRASLEGKCVAEIMISGGFARVASDMVTVLTDKAEIRDSAE